MNLVIFYVTMLAILGLKRDVVILDVDSKDSSLGMSCPPAAFVEDSFIQSVANVLNPSGKRVVTFYLLEINCYRMFYVNFICL